MYFKCGVIAQQPAPLLLLGDFNAHNPLWGGNKVDGKGKSIEECLGNHGLCFAMVDLTPTYTHGTALTLLLI